MYDPATRQVHADPHLLPDPSPDLRRGRQQHAVDLERRWPAPGVVGWLNRKMFEETGDEVQSQGWTPFILDTNGNGKRDDVCRAQPAGRSDEGQAGRGQPLQRRREPERRLGLGNVAGLSRATSCASRPGSDPTHTALTEIYEPPLPGYGPRGGDIDRNGVFWASLASGHLGELRPQQVQGPLNGPNATGKHCPEGWTLYRVARPAVQGREGRRQRRGELLHLGRPVQHVRAGRERADRHRQHERRATSRWSTASSSTCACPTRWASSPSGREGRIDDPNAGWKGRALWATYSTAPCSTSKAARRTGRRSCKFQLRPDPLAR